MTAARALAHFPRAGRNEIPALLDHVTRKAGYPHAVVSVAAMLAWSGCEFPCYYISWTRWRRLFRGAPKDIELPVRLYRGEDTAGWSKGIDHGASWTTEKETAEFFAQRSAQFAQASVRTGVGRFKDAQPQIATFMLTQRGLLLAVYEEDMGRNEHEVILDPARLRAAEKAAPLLIDRYIMEESTQHENSSH